MALRTYEFGEGEAKADKRGMLGGDLCMRKELANFFDRGEYDALARHVDLLVGNANTVPCDFFSVAWHRKEFVQAREHLPGGYAEKRIALAAGNSGYQDVGPCRTRPTMQRWWRACSTPWISWLLNYAMPALRRLRLRCRIFPETANDADIALMYFAGHGIEVYFDVVDETVALERVSRAT
jgi:hypothetical protein